MDEEASVRVPAILVAFLCVAASPEKSIADQPVAKTCPRLPGMMPGPTVPNQETATAIFKAVVSNWQTPDEASKFELGVERDKTDPETWLVSQGYPDQIVNGQRVVTYGGGFEMKIDRCTGAVRDFHGVR